MKSAKLVDIKKLELTDIPVPELSQGQVLVSIKACGVCGSDVHYYHTGRIGSDKAVFPQSLGHEPAGQIVKAFSGSRLKEGTRVAIEPARPCLSCELCVTGHYNCCPNVKFLGSPRMPGAFQEFLAVDESQVHAIPDSISYVEAAILEPLGVAYHTIRLADLKAGQTVAIFGSGPIGLLTLAMAKACGAGETFVFDKIQYRLDFAKSMYGADHAINVNDIDPLQYIKDHTNGRGVDLTCEAAGQPQTVNWALESARICGRSMIIGIPEVDSIAFNPHPMRRKELLIQNVRRSNLALGPCADLVERGTVRVKELATNLFTLDNISDAFETVLNYRDGVIRAIITG